MSKTSCLSCFTALAIFLSTHSLYLANEHIPDFIYNDTASLNSLKHHEFFKNTKIDNSLIDERVLNILNAFYTGYMKKELLKEINFEHIAEEILDDLNQKTESTHVEYNEDYWNQNTILKELLTQPEHTMHVAVDDYLELSYTITHHDILIKILEYQICVYTYEILYEKVKYETLYDTGIPISTIITFPTPIQLKEDINPLLKNKNTQRIEEVQLPNNIIPEATKEIINSYIQRIPAENLVPYTDGLLSSFKHAFLARQIFKELSDWKFIPSFEKNSNKLFGITGIQTFKNSTPTKS